MDCKIKDLTDYQAVADQVTNELSSDKNRFVPMEERLDTSVLSVDILASLCHGKTCMIVNSLLLITLNRNKQVQCFLSAL